MKIYQQLREFKPINDQEKQDQTKILNVLNLPDVFTRKNTLGHFCASGWILNETHDAVLMCYHRIYQSFSWLGGHSDGNSNLLEVALKEVKEESGLQNIKVLDEHIFSLEILPVFGHIKHGQYVSSHLHYNVTYLFEASSKEQLIVKEDENSELKWIKIEELEKYVEEKWMYENVYCKLVKKALRY